MNAMLRFPLAALLAVAAPALAQSNGADGRPHDTIAPLNVAAKDPVMEATKVQARRTLPGFLKLLANPPAGTADYAIKYPLPGPEFIWVSDLQIAGRELVGTLANYPENPDFTLGQQVRVPLNAVSDWGYRDASGVMQGHFTTRVLIGRLSPADAVQALQVLGWDK